MVNIHPSTSVIGGLQQYTPHLRLGDISASYLWPRSQVDIYINSLVLGLRPQTRHFTAINPSQLCFNKNLHVSALKAVFPWQAC